MLTAPHPSDEARWQPQRLDWSVAFPRSPQHLSNQLRGKRLSRQLELFEDVFNQLKPEVQREVREKSISVVGFDLSVNQQRAYEAGLRLLACSNYQTRRVVITPEDWFQAYDLERRKTSRGWLEVSGQERADAIAALIGLAGMPWLISYKKQEHGRWYLIQRVTTCWRVELKTLLGDVTPGSPGSPGNPATAGSLKIPGNSGGSGGRGGEGVAASGDGVTPDRISQIEKIAIEFDDVWFDQREQYYFYKPARLYTRIALTLPGKIKRQPQHLHPFLDWIFAEAGRLRVLHKHEPSANLSWTISSPWVDLAHQCRLTRQLEHRNYKRVQQALLDSAALAQSAQVISSYQLEGDTFTVTFDNGIFADLDEYLTQQKEKRQRQQARGGDPRPRDPRPRNPGPGDSHHQSPGKSPSTLWKDRSRFSLAEINKLIAEHEEEIKTIRMRLHYEYDVQRRQTVPDRDFTPEEQEHLAHHRAAIQELKEIKLGVRPLAG